MHHAAPPNDGPQRQPLRPPPSKGRLWTWFGIGFIGSLVSIALGVGFSMLFTYSDTETEAYAGPVFGFGGYLLSILALPVLCVIVENARPPRTAPLAAITFAGTLMPGALLFVVFFVLAAALNA